MQSLCEAAPPASVRRACDALGLSRATVYRRRSPKPRRTAERRARTSPRALSADERERVVATLHSEEFADQPPREVYAALLSLGIYLASVRTMYRILKSLDQLCERRRGHVRTRHAMPQLEAFAPNEVWTWDITKVAGEAPGVYFCLHVVIDLFSRMIVGWMVAETENAALAGHLLTATMEQHEVPAGTLTVHSDRGAPMTAGSMTKLLATLGVTQSFSRPKVSNDNPFVESCFKTTKYQPEYPGKFGSIEHVRAWFQTFFDWYCFHHHHEGLALFTPADVHFGRVPEVAATRQAALDEAYAAHPERFVHGPPRVPLPPARAHINLRRADEPEPASSSQHEILAADLRRAAPAH